MEKELIVFRKNQIEAIARLICPECGDKCYTCMFGKWKPCKAKAIAEKIYDEGFSKQGTGEWSAITTEDLQNVKTKAYHCPICGKSNGFRKSNYCSNCGARLKGGAE